VMSLYGGWPATAKARSQTTMIGYPTRTADRSGIGVRLCRSLAGHVERDLMPAVCVIPTPGSAERVPAHGTENGRHNRIYPPVTSANSSMARAICCRASEIFCW